MDLDQLLDELNVKDSPPKKAQGSKPESFQKGNVDDWGDEKMVIEPKGHSKPNQFQKPDSDDEWGDTDVNQGDKKNDDVLESASSEGSHMEEEKEERKVQKPSQNKLGMP